MKDLKRLGYEVRQARVDQSVSQDQLASQIGVDKSLLSKVENGHYRPTEAQLQAIIDALRMPSAKALEIWSLSGRSSGPVVQATHVIAGKERNIVMEEKTNAKPSGQSINIMLDPNKAPVLYSDIMNVMSTEFGITLIFAQMVGPNGGANVVSQIGVSFQHARKIAEAIMNELDKHER